MAAPIAQSALAHGMQAQNPMSRHGMGAAWTRHGRGMDAQEQDMTDALTFQGHPSQQFTADHICRLFSYILASATLMSSATVVPSTFARA